MGDRLLGGQPAVSLNVEQHHIQRLVGLARDGAGDALARLNDLLRLDGNIAGAPPPAPPLGWWIRKRVLGRLPPLTRRSQEQMRGRTAHPACADHVHRGSTEAQDVMDNVTRFEVPAGRAH